MLSRYQQFTLNADHIPLLCGKNTLKSWKFDLSMDPVKETEIKLEDVFMDCFETTGKHIALPLYKEEDIEDVMITEAEECFEDPPTRHQPICQVAIGDDFEDAEEEFEDAKEVVGESDNDKAEESEVWEDDIEDVMITEAEEWSTDDTVYLVNGEADPECVDSIMKIHKATNHKSENNLLHAYRNAAKLTSKVRQSIKNAVDSCEICRKYKRSQGTPKVALPKVVDFNQIVTLDLKQFGKQNVLWAVCSFTRFIQGIVLPNKTANAMIEGLDDVRNWRFGFPSQGFWMDNGGEFKNAEFEEYASKANFNIRFGPTYSPWSNGLNERNHHSADITVNKMMEADKKLSLQKAVKMAAWTHNTNVNVLGYNPMTLVTGKSVVMPGITTGNLATESMFDSEAVKKIMERHHDVTRRSERLNILQSWTEHRNRQTEFLMIFSMKRKIWFYIKRRTRKGGMDQKKYFVTEEEMFGFGQMVI